jgi:hypothetical protein
MRKIFLPLALAFFGCSSDNTVRPDLSVPHDMSVSHDLGGQFVCDPVKQDCGAGKKCTYILDPNDNTMIIPSCVDVAGTQGFEMPCTRNGNGDPGDDNCAAGFFCSIIGWGGTTTNPDRHCNQMCNTTADCPANHHCISRTTFSGDCIRDCGALGSTSCGGGLVCSTLLQDIDATMADPKIFLTCRTAGPGGPADTCMEDAECQANLACSAADGTCDTFLCDDNHMCPNTDAAFTCGTFGTSSGSLGICQ